MKVEFKKGKKSRRAGARMLHIDPPDELRSTLPTARSLQLPADPFGGYGGELYPLPGGLKFSQLLQCIATNPTLLTAISTRAALTAMSGAEVVETLGAENHDFENKRRLQTFVGNQRAWRAGAGVFGLGSVVEQVVWDRIGLGAGNAEALPPETQSPGRQGSIDPTEPRIVGVAHLPRMNVRLVKPDSTNRRIGGTTVTKTAADDLMYPRLVYSQREIAVSGAAAAAIGYVRYLKAFGDHREIDAESGAAKDGTPWERQATEYLRWRAYMPGYEEGWAEWVSGLGNVNQTDAISRYYTHLFRRNAIPDLIMIIRNAKVRDNFGEQAEERFRATRQRREHNDNYTAVAVFDFPAVQNSTTGEVIKVEVELHKLNPLDGPVIRSVLEMEERADRKIAMALRMPAQLINYPTRGGLGGGSEMRAVVQMLSQLVIVPDQAKIHGMLDQITEDGMGIPDWRIRLIPPAYNDPETEAKIYQAIDGISSLMTGEKRAYMGYGSLKEILEQAKADAENEDAVQSKFDPDRTFVLGMNDQMVPLSDMALLAGHLAPPDRGGLPEGDERDKAKEELESLVSGMDGGDVAQVFDTIVERSRKQIERVGAAWRPEMTRSAEELDMEL